MSAPRPEFAARKRRPSSTCHHCGEPVKRGRLMCPTHWFAIPKRLRQGINATWKGRQFRAYLTNVREAERLLSGSEEDQNSVTVWWQDEGADA